VKDIIVKILGKKYKLHYTKKNFNSLIGLPLTIFELNGDEEFLVLEMGTSNPGEIARLCDIAKPTIGMITNIGPGHLEGLKSIAAIRHEKLSLLDCLPDNGFAVLGDDIDLQTKKEILKFSLRSASQINLSESGSSFTCKEKKFSTQLLGINNIYNCLGGIRLTERIGVEYELQRAAIAEVEPEPGRLAPIKINDLLIINDTYNANPVSMKAAIDFVSSLNRRKIFVLGDMLELGKDSKRLHQWVGKYVVKKCDLLLTYGRQAEYYGGRHYTHKASLIRALKAHLTGDEVILVKASRALRFEEIVNQL
jgi:UDP-N-acetylmuramoyl-tripeptide--D-alanyl-D-alanine ligase